MRLIDIVNAPWAVTPDMLNEIQGIYGRHLRGDKIDLQNLTAATGITFDNQPKGYSVQDGVAVLLIDGVIAKRMNLMTKISGGVSSELVGRDFASAMADRSVEAVVLAIDSPGGTVDGTPELAQLIASYRGTKPVLACTDGMMCSAAYWIGAAADRINISSEVAVVGSIGVVAKHVDVSKAEEKAGVKTTEIYAGKYKRIASQYGALTEEGRESIQEAVDHVYSVFVDDVARFRGVDAATVLEGMADGKVFNGSKAIEAGLVDGVATLSETIQQARELARGKKQNSRAGVAQASNQTTKKEVMTMTIEQLKADHPELVEAITAEATAGQADAIAAATAAGAQAERDRIAQVRAQSIPGHEALIEQLAFDGTSTGADAALAIVAAEKQARESALAQLDADNQPVVPSVVDATATSATMKRKDFDALDQTARRAFLAEGGKITA